MKKITFLKLFALAFLFLSANIAKSQSTFGNDNLAVLVAAASANNTTVSIVEINKTDLNQSPIQTINVPGSGTDAIRVSGSATSTLYAANSADGSLFCFTGHKSDATTGNANTILTRAVITVNHTGTVNIPTTYSGTSGNQTRCATTLDNSNFYISDQGGQFTNNAITASPVGNFRSIKTFGGVVYVCQSSSTTTTIQVATTSALTGGTITGLPGLTNNNTIQDFYLVSSGSNANSYDLLYVLKATSNTAGAIDKYSLVDGTWVANGSFTTDFGGFGLCAEKSGAGANLYLTTGQGALAANKVKKLFDNAGFNMPIDITTANIVDLYTAPTGTILKGLAFAPKHKVDMVKTPTFSSMKIAGFKITYATLPQKQIQVYSISGSGVAVYAPAQTVELKLQKGIYIVLCENETAKVVLR
jgi:hypothetical protein